MDRAAPVLCGPCVPIGLVYALGVLAGAWKPLPLILLFALAASLLALAALLRTRREVLLGLTLVLLGWANLNLRTTVLSPLDLRRLCDSTPCLARVRGRLPSTPTTRTALRRDRESRHTLAVLDVSALGVGTDWRPATGQIVVHTPGTLSPAYFAGRTVIVEGLLRHPGGALAEGLFDYAACLRWRGIDFELQAGDAGDWQLAPAPGDAQCPPWTDRFAVWAQRVLASGLPVEDEPLQLLWAMSLGWTTALTNEVALPFMRTGTMHIFAISGLHIVLISGILVALLRVLQVPRSRCGVVVLPLIWAYTAATGWQPSAVRSTLMTSVVVLGWGLRRPPDLLNSLAAAGFLLLVWDPRQLFQAGFQLSFFVVLALALLVPPLSEWKRRWLAPDPFLPAELVPAWRRRLEEPANWLLTSLATSFAAWLGSWPWIATYFHLLTPGSLAANLLVVPLSSLALMSNLGSLACGDWCPLVTELFNHSAWFWMSCTIRLCDLMAGWPGCWLYVAAPGLGPVMAYYVMLLAFSVEALRAGRRWLFTLALPATVIAGACGLHWHAQRQSTELTILGLSRGAALWIDAPGGANDLLIDCGDEPSAAGGVMPFLASRGVNRLPRLLLTHGDVRHVGGAPRLLPEFRPRTVTRPIGRSRSPAMRQVEQWLETQPQRSEMVAAGDLVAGWRVCHPGEEIPFPRADDNALVLLKECEGVRILLLSDLGPRGQERLLNRGADLRADLVVTGIPTGGEPLGEALLDAIRPSIVIVQDAEFPAWDRLGEATRTRLAARGASVLATTTEGTIRVRCQAGRWEVESRSGLHWAGVATQGPLTHSPPRPLQPAPVPG